MTTQDLSGTKWHSDRAEPQWWSVLADSSSHNPGNFRPDGLQRDGCRVSLAS